VFRPQRALRPRRAKRNRRWDNTNPDKDKLKKRLKQLALGPQPAGGAALATLTASGKVKTDIAGTGETIGHVADLKIQNLTDQPLTCAIPPMILESVSGKNQHYACPRGQTVALNPQETKTVPMNGVCLNRNKPPVQSERPAKSKLTPVDDRRRQITAQLRGEVHGS
jgi:hypothetical protein